MAIIAKQEKELGKGDISSIAQQINQRLARLRVTNIHALTIACAFAPLVQDILDGLVDLEDIEESLENAISYTVIVAVMVKAGTSKKVQDFDVPDAIKLLVDADLITLQGEKGPKLAAMLEDKIKSYPTIVGEPMIRLRTKTKKDYLSGCIKRATRVLEATVSRVNVPMLETLEKAHAGDKNYANAWILRACRELVDIGNPWTYSEYFNDAGGRLYMGTFHGPNAQSGDEARSLMDLKVSQDYDIDRAILAVENEMSDMTKNFKKSIKDLKKLGDIKFIQTKGCKKSASFVKGARILKELKKKNKQMLQ